MMAQSYRMIKEECSHLLCIKGKHLQIDKTMAQNIRSSQCSCFAVSILRSALQILLHLCKHFHDDASLKPSTFHLRHNTMAPINLVN